MRALRAYSRYWAFACALLFLPWMQLAMAAPSARQGSCCESMAGMASMAMSASRLAMHGSTRAAAGTANLSACMAMCLAPSASLPGRPIQARIPRLAIGVPRMTPVVSALVSPRSWRRVRDKTPRAVQPTFLAARLQV